jgi:hypothetical protein
MAGGISPISSSSTVPPAAAGERPAPVPEQLALEQRLGERGAVDGQERPLGARPRAMDAARHQLLAGAGLAFDEHRDRRRRRALHECEHRRHRGRAPDDVGKAHPADQIATQGADLRPQALLGRLQAGVELGVLERHRDAARQRLEEGQVGVVERARVAVHHLQDADRSLARDQRRGQDAAGEVAGRPVDAGIEAGIGLDVVDPDRLAGLQRCPRNAAVGGEAEAGESDGDVLPLGDDVGEIELALRLVEEEHRRPLGVEHLAHLAHHERDQLVEFDLTGKGAPEFVEEPEPPAVVGEGKHPTDPNVPRVPGKVGGWSMRLLEVAPR